MILLFLFAMVFPILMVKNIKYNAMRTRLNNMRFNFHYSPVQVWWVMAGLPVVSDTKRPEYAPALILSRKDYSAAITACCSISFAFASA
ncbi:DUF898 family protein [Citrobacter amalonaticus]|uniref:DUF898 family protein n=1 Tax=Citrobacter amalonaticus TaxID=35703 RepID=UPI0035B5E893